MTMNFRKGVHGPEVKTLQEALKKEGFSVVPDGLFSLYTEQALRAYQRKTGLLPDGLAGPRVRAALGIASENELKSLPKYASYEADLMHRIGSFMAEVLAFARAKYMFYTPSLPPSAMKISPAGLRFIFTHETLPNISNHLYWPRGSSGVTLGPGYDMKKRSTHEVISDLTAIGIDEATAKKAAAGVGLEKEAADKFKTDNYHLINLTKEQEMRLLMHIVPKYEKIIKKHIHIDLVQHEYDALVSFAYNPGGGFTKIATLINQWRAADAMIEVQKRSKSGGGVLQALIDRRKAEVSLYAGGLYGKLRYTEIMPKC